MPGGRCAHSRRPRRPRPIATTCPTGGPTRPAAATLAVEAAVHFLDLTVGLPSAPPPDPASAGLVRRVLDGLLGQPLPTGWDDVEYALKGTGRVPLTAGDRSLLGPLAARFPLFG
jgi:hypothetical protein